jgi:tryptophan halogenase
MPYNQFHFNTYKLNDFLIDVAKHKGINIIEDEILDVNFDEHGNISSLKGEKYDYDHDFYIDATGFKRLLIGQMGAKWRSFSRYLKMKSAITFQTADEDNYNLWTLSRAMDYGWLFRIPVWGRYGNGYIFDSDYITADQAKLEAERYFGKNLDIGKQFNFDPGMLDRVWIKNCCAVGISGSFVEPLEATSIGTTIQQSFLLMHRLINYNDKVIEQYNKSFTDILENIRDFIVLHYITRKNNTNFWRDAAGIELPDSLNNNLETWRRKLPIREDFNQLSDYIMFYEANFILVLEGLDLFDRSAIKKEYESHLQWIKDEATKVIEDRYNTEDTADTLPHKVFIGLIRDYC